MTSKQVLENVEKAEKFNQRIVELFDEKEWTRENFERNAEKVANTYQTIDELIQDLENDLDQVQSKLQQKVDDFGEDNLEELEKQNMGKDYSPTLIHFKKLGNERRQINQRIKEYQAYQKELYKNLVDKLEAIAKGYKKDFVGGEVAENVMEAVDSQIEDKIEKEVAEIRTEFEREKGQLEQALEAMRRENKYYRDAFDNLVDALFKTVADELGNTSEEIEELKEEVSEKVPELDDLTGENGRVSLRVDSSDDSVVDDVGVVDDEDAEHVDSGGGSGG